MQKQTTPIASKKLLKGFMVSALLGQQHVIRLVADVADQPVVEESQASIEAIKDAALHSLMDAGISDDRFFVWISSCVLASYELGRNGKNMPLKSRKKNS